MTTFVEVVDDRQPRTALLLLRYFDLSTNDVALKKRIADAVKYVQAGGEMWELPLS